MIFFLAYGFLTLLLNWATGLPNNPKFCVSTRKAFSMDKECSTFSNLLDKVQCVIVLNRFEELKDHQDEFNYVKLVKGETIVYSLNVNMYKTKCDSVEGIEFPNFVENCTRDLPVTYLKSGIVFIMNISTLKVF